MRLSPRKPALSWCCLGVVCLRVGGLAALFLGWLWAAASRTATSQQQRRAAHNNTNSIHSIPFSFSRWGCGEEKRNWWNWAAGRGRVGLSFLCGLRAGPPAIAPHKEDKHSPATLPFNKFILSFFFFLARRAWTVLVVGYGWGPALCRGRTQSNWFHQFPLSSLPSFVSLKKKERVDWLINKRKDEREWNDCLWDESWRAIQP